MENEIIRLQTRIWWTSKTRMQSEKRLRTYEMLSHVGIALLSVLLIGFTIYSGPNNPNINAHLITLSVFITVLSVLIFGFKFGEQATLHRECYLKLDELRDSELKYDEMKKSYHKILASYPNHASCDHSRIIINETLFGHGKLQDSNGNEVKWTLLSALSWFFSYTLPWVLITFVLAFSLFSPTLMHYIID
ncbi:SLATT domain-containing protein [Ahrensia sp. 13_GOM-1096m]|uniref:SLATT domain-containing protein n=1 Tax=Ahrensia sp. 13_GOM-1096m TaxID=1380380 RepID=UPI00138ABDFB|nr:SLATT domain-containing protein [Ahrensia sp. 13_GOM-1096m]